MIVAAVDMGTTNSRVRLIENGKIVSHSKSSVGIKDVSITGKKDILLIELKRITEIALGNIKKSFSDIQYFVASGMITSNLGLCEVPHEISPVSAEQLSKRIVKKTFVELDNIPVYFIPGVKNQIAQKDIGFLHQMDMMRGEEVETFGIIERYSIEGPSLLVLPGSHTKFVYIDEENRIAKCSSSMAGELIQCVSNYTILSQCLGKSLVTEIDEEYLTRGMKFEEENNLTKALFAVRLMDTQLSTSENQRANFLAGAIVSNDISDKMVEEIKENGYKKIYIGGSNPLKDIFKIILDNKNLGNIEIIALPNEVTETASTIGALKIVNMAVG